jgi:prepilin-type N-terminal cleavage/methylation domain-containing protein
LKTNKGFTLIELLVTLAVLSFIAVITIVAINPIEQVRRAKDAANRQNAESFLSAISRYQATKEKNPEIEYSTTSVDWSDIIEAGPVYNFTSLQNEISEWFSQLITRTGSELYLGMNAEGRTKVCYKVNAFTSVAKVPRNGCSISASSYLCLPE